MPTAAPQSNFAEFQQYLMGTWTNMDFPGSKQGGKENPLSYNIMPLPQMSPTPADNPDFPGYILKNFTYYETIRFNSNVNTAGEIALSVLAPNRGSTYQQNSYALFYSQQVHFAEGPKATPTDPDSENSVVHVENGAWLFLTTTQQNIGPYGMGGQESGPVIPEPPDLTIAKQISVPHGNSILALGSFDALVKGSPAIPDALSAFPTPAGLTTDSYTQLLNETDDYQNPQPDFTANCNLPLQQAVDIIKPDSYIHWKVTTDPLPSGQGVVTNIPFEQKLANVTGYTAEYWLLSTDGGNTFNYLAYTQNISIALTINGVTYNFPHVTANTVTRVS